VAYGKALGGGYPIGAFGGKAAIMDLVTEDRMGLDDKYVWTASSLGGNPISCAAALASLSVLRSGNSYEHLFRIGEYLRQGIRRVFKEREVNAVVVGDGPLASFVFCSDPIKNYREQKKKEDGNKRRAVMLALFEEGVFVNPMGTKLYVSLAHDERVCDEFLRILGNVCDTLKN